MQNMTANWIRNGKDMINLEGVRNNRNTDISDYNCFGYAFGAYSWLLPYDTDEEDERYFGEWKDEEEDDCAEFAAANILEGFKGLARRIDSLDELQDGEYGVLLKTGQDDFHFVKYFPKSKTFFHKPGGTRIRRMSRAEALGDKWYGSCNTYCSKTIFFAMKER